MEYKVDNHYSLDLSYSENKYKLDYEMLFNLATRNNPKRRFLFVSNVLGKHIAVRPNKALAAARLLAMDYYEKHMNKEAFDREELIKGLKDEKSNYMIDNRKAYKIDEDVIVIGFAETATGLAHGVFDSFENARAFYHTTREVLDYKEEVISFEEEHSHATSHRVYENSRLKLKDAKKIILVDDEISTGNTLINIMKSINKQFGIRNFSVLTLLDWRNEKSQKNFEEFSKEFEIEVDVCSLVKGEIKGIVHGQLGLDEISKHDLFSEHSCKSNEIKRFEKSIYIDDFSDMDINGKKSKEERSSSYSSYTGRFGLNQFVKEDMNEKYNRVASKLQGYVKGKTLVLGTEEFIYLPLKIASFLKGDIHYKSTTRSPIYPFDSKNYPIRSGISFESFYNKGVKNYVYNISEEKYDTILILVEKFDKEISAHNLYKALENLAPNIRVVYFYSNKEKSNSYPPIIGSYSEDDVVFLLKEVSGGIEEQDNYSRERAIQAGVHYSEMLPIEYKPTEEYIDIFHRSLKSFSKKLALAVAITAEKLIKARGEDVVLVSLARAGSPAGVLLKRYLKSTKGIDLAHYSISIIRGRGIDENAISFILENHPGQNIQFIDGWTGKGAITKELREAVEKYKKYHGEYLNLSYELAVLADPGNCVEIYGTREDFLIPNACLNSTVSGLLSRTVLRDDLIGEEDYHGVKHYTELMEEDLSNYYIGEIEKHFKEVHKEAINSVIDFDLKNERPMWTGLEDVNNIRESFDIDNIHFVKPGIGETTRVLLRRIPWKILVREDSKNLEHVLKLAKEKNIQVETYPLKAYHCCGIVKALKGE